MRTGVFRFGGFVLDVPAYELRRQGRSVRLERRPMELLLLLVDRRGELITRDEIVARLWGRDVFIDIDTSVNTAIRKIRRALRDSADEARFVQTVQGKGYRFIADVEAATSEVLAVLPFENLQGDPNHDYLADGLTEETIVGLGQFDPERLSVIGRRSSMAYRGTSKTLSEIGRELGTDYLLEGSVRSSRGRVRVTVTLVRTHDQVQIWTEAFERESNDLLGLQAELGRAIARQIQLRLTPRRTTTITKRHTHDAGAYDFYLRGRYHYNQMTPATTARALDCFHRATALDDTYALAWAGIADAYSSRLFASDTRSSDVADQARAAAQQALQNGRSVAEAHAAMGRVHFLFAWDWQSAEACLRHAIALDPSSAPAHWMLGHTFSQQGRHDEALASARRARELEPFDALSHSMSAQIAFSARDLEAAARHASDSLQTEPDYWIGYWQLGQALQQLDRVEEALKALAEASRLSAGNSKPLSLQAYTLAAAGRVSEARALLTAMEEASRVRYLPPYAIALVHAGLNDDLRAFESLEQAAIMRDAHLIYVIVDPKWDRLRQATRFQELLQRSGLSADARTTMLA
jgi:TolB-like protein/Flp pilus assembly protein TadD